MFGELFGFVFFVRGIPIFPCELQATRLILPPKNYDHYHWYLCQLAVIHCYHKSRGEDKPLYA